MLTFITRTIQPTRINKVPPCRYFATKVIKLKSAVSKSMTSKYTEQMRDQQIMSKYKTRSKIQNSSGYQDVKRMFRQCGNADADAVFRIMSNNKKCEDVQVGTAAMKTIKILHVNKQVSREIAMEKIDDIWQMMNEYVVGMDLVAYNEYFSACNVTGFAYKCADKFTQMCDENVEPNLITLKLLLTTCLKKGGTKLALYYWNKIVLDMKQSVNAECWAVFLQVCAAEQNRELAEEYFYNCPYKHDVDVCYRMLSVYQFIGDVDKVLEMRKYMEQSKIEIDLRTYNSIANVYRQTKQYQQAINVAKEAISINKWSVITIKHLFEATIGIIKNTEDFQQRKELLKYIEHDVLNYFEKAEDEERLKSSRHGKRMLDAYVSTYRDSFGSQTFVECCSKYHVQYWEDVEYLNIPTLNLFGCNYGTAKAILEYVFEKEHEVFRNLGVNIIVMSERNIKSFVDNPVNAEVANSILSSLPTSMIAIHKEPNLLYISSDQTQNYTGDGDDEPMFD
eukprot:499166_1